MESEIVQEYVSGTEVEEIARKFDINVSKIYEVLKKDNIPKRGRRRFGEKNSMFGKKQSAEARKKMRESGKGLHTNEKNSMWKGDKVGKAALHDWVKRNKPKPDFCENCEKVPPYDLANISQEYKRDVNDFKWLCRSCHMKEDGRLKQLQMNHKPPKKGIQIEITCSNCGKVFYVIPSQAKKRKTCSRKCMGEIISKEKRFYGNQFIK